MGAAEHQFPASDGAQLFVREYPSSVASARKDTVPADAALHVSAAAAAACRTLVVVHGASEHGGRYEEFARAASRHGWRVLVPDLRGHGLSEGVPVHVDRFARYLDDLQLLFQRWELSPAHTALLGHSFGGLIVTRFVQQHPRSVRAAVLLGPLFGVAIRIPWYTWLAGRLVALLLPRTRFSSRIRSGDLTRDPTVIERRKQDPLMRRGVTAGWYVQGQIAIRDAFRLAPEMQLPLLILHGGEDRIADPLATQRWAEAAGSQDKRLQIYPQHLHELLNEPDSGETTQEILDWLAERVPG